MVHHFEAAESTLIQVVPYKKAQKLPSGTGRQANISDVDFSGGRGSSGVDLRWYHPKEFWEISKDHKDDLVDWMYSNDGNNLMKSYSKAAQTNKNKVSGSGKQGDKKLKVAGTGRRNSNKR